MKSESGSSPAQNILKRQQQTVRYDENVLTVPVVLVNLENRRMDRQNSNFSDEHSNRLLPADIPDETTNPRMWFPSFDRFSALQRTSAGRPIRE